MTGCLALSCPPCSCFWCPCHSVSGAGEALGSGCNDRPAYLRLQLHRAWRLESLCSGKIGGGGGGRGVIEGEIQHGHRRQTPTATYVWVAASHFCPFTKPSGKGQVGSRYKYTERDRRGRQRKTPAEASPASLTVCPPAPPLLFITGPAHDMALRRCTVRAAWMEMGGDLKEKREVCVCVCHQIVQITSRR